MPSIPPRKKPLATSVKSYANTEIKTFLSCPNLFDFFTFLIAMNFDIVWSLAVIAVEQYSSDWGSQKWFKKASNRRSKTNSNKSYFSQP